MSENQLSENSQLETSQLEKPETSDEPSHGISRRNFLWISAGAAVAAGAGVRLVNGPNRAAADGGMQPWVKNEFTPSPLETRVLGASTLLAGSKAGLRIVTLDHRDGAPIANAVARVAILVPDAADKTKKIEKTLFSGRTNRRGTVDASFQVPPLPKGNYELKVNTAHPAVGSDEFAASVVVSDAAQILLTTDKPLYQPQQTIHLRALSLARPELKPVANKALVFEVEDAKGNKVFKHETDTGKMGVASAEFVLGDEINLGHYTVRAVVGDVVNEKKVTVDKYVLPKFKVAVSTAKKYYLPGEVLQGTLQVDYFFGKPVAGGEAVIKFSTFDAGFNQFTELRGKTDGNGAYKFETKLLESFVGLPLEQGNAFVQMEVEIVDTAAHLEKVTHTVPVAKDAVLIAVVPESGELAPGLQNTIYVLTTYPDGTPAPCRFTLSNETMNYPGSTDRMGIGEVRITPRQDENEVAAQKPGREIGGFPGGGFGGFAGGFAPGMNEPARPPVPITVEARDGQGNTGKTQVQLQRGAAEESLLLRTDKAVARVGESLNIEIISTRQGGTTYVDMVKDKQTMLTQSVSLRGGQASLRVPLDETLAGTLQLDAYIITPGGEIVRDTKIVYVNPANDLQIAVSANQKTYRPGAPAQIDLKVSDKRGRPVAAALGVNIVDESVFALQEMQPGMEKVYFTLEKELLEPKVEIHGYTAEGIVPMVDDKPRPDAGQQKLAKVLFAAAQPTSTFGINWNSYDAKMQEVAGKWNESLTRDGTKIAKALEAYNTKNQQLPAKDNALRALLDAQLLAPADLTDPLGTPYDLKPQYGDSFDNGFVLRSAGPDKKLDTPDDVTVFGSVGGDVYANNARFARRRGGVMFEGDMAFDNFAGGFGGGGFAGGAMVPMPPMASAAAPVGVASEKAMQPQSGAAEPVRVRQFFPETLFVAPQVLTDERGVAKVNLDMADSITTWRLTTMASSGVGAMGSTSSPLRVFQDFFVDIDLPVSLTQNDEVSLPVAVYNYLPQKQTVNIKLDTGGDWFELGSDTAEKSVAMEANQVGVVYFNLVAKKIGDHKLSVTARGSKLSDAMQRSIQVLPDGKETWDTINDRLEGKIAKTMTIPAAAIEGGSNLLVRIYPGAFSQMVDGLDKMLRMPFGCFEQNASVAYPNILVMDYLKQTKQIKPELQMKAESYINAGYQRALTYEVQGGGYSWFGNAPAHQVLTAYGVLMFHDMSQVFNVDAAVIARTQQWLASRQKPDGSWEVDQGGIQEGIINRQTDALRVSAYVLWSLAETGYNGGQVGKAAQWVGARIAEADDAYSLAVIANALVSVDKNSEVAARALEKLVGLKTEEARVAYWENKGSTFTGAKSDSADIETTALAVYALLKSGRYGALVNKVLTYLVQQKDPQGTWGSTQGTVWSLRSLLAAMDKAAGDTNGEVIVRVNGQQAGAFAITPKDADVMRQIEMKEYLKEGANAVEINFAGEGSALYAISSKYYLPWRGAQNTGEKAPLAVDVAYDRTELAVNDIVTCRVQATNNQPLGVQNVIVDLGVPPGFEVQSGDLAELVGSKKIAKFSQTGRQVIVYLDGLKAGETLDFEYRLKAKFPLKAQTPPSAVYEYYTPNHRAESAPVGLVVRKA